VSLSLGRRANQVLPGETLGTCLSTILGVWLMVFLYAAIHDQFLIRIHPEHFTVWHYEIPFTRDLSLLALLYAFGGSISPGLLLGTALYVAGRLFDLPKKSRRWIFLRVGLVIVVAEICAVAAGLLAWRTGRGVYPDFLYPDYSAGLAITQSVQLTAYLAGGFFSLLLLAWTWWSRLNERRRLRVVPN
jgi:hypothetical protein